MVFHSPTKYLGGDSDPVDRVHKTLNHLGGSLDPHASFLLTLITRPAAISHVGMSLHDRDRLGITADLIRISSGIEGTRT